ncbi:MAG: hypothetical protein BGO05_27365 [Rhizobiales bacterium 63-7]|nr:hypothetical protein [Hyphomicrobiales bacterium]OJU70329.1 MAG: hypothetical protein BGO05_27365 [Rhizobiales bacterium 63-7]
MVTPSDHASLRRILKKADYVTLDMKAEDGPGRHEETLIIRRIAGGTISSAEYLVSRRQKRNASEAAICSWENEGGAVAATKLNGEKP